jgi:hypothetical protein
MQAEENSAIIEVFPEGLMISRIEATTMNTEFLSPQSFEHLENYLWYLHQNNQTVIAYNNKSIEPLLALG